MFFIYFKNSYTLPYTKRTSRNAAKTKGRSKITHESETRNGHQREGESESVWQKTTRVKVVRGFIQYACSTRHVHHTLDNNHPQHLQSHVDLPPLTPTGILTRPLKILITASRVTYYSQIRYGISASWSLVTTPRCSGCSVAVAGRASFTKGLCWDVCDGIATLPRVLE